MTFLISLPILTITAILQTTVVSQMPLLGGTADLMLIILTAWVLQRQVQTSWQWSVVGGLLIDYFSGFPFGVFTISYLLINGAGLIFRRRIWQFTYLIHLLLTILGTLIIHGFSVIIILLQGTALNFEQVLQHITLPSLLLNLLLSYPLYILMKDIADQFHPQTINI